MAHTAQHPATSAAIYDPSTSNCRASRLPPETDVVTAELYALHQALTYLDTHAKGKAVIYTDSLSSLHLLLSQHPALATPLVHATQDTHIHFNSQGLEIKLQWVPSHTNIRGNDVVNAAAKMAVSQDSITPLPLPLSTAKHLISRTCQSTWNNTLSNTLLNTNMGQYHTLGETTVPHAGCGPHAPSPRPHNNHCTPLLPEPGSRPLLPLVQEY